MTWARAYGVRGLLSETGNRWVGTRSSVSGTVTWSIFIRQPPLRTRIYHKERITGITISTPITLLSRTLCCRTVHTRRISNTTENISLEQISKNSNPRTLWSFWCPGSFFLTMTQGSRPMSHHVNHAVAEAQAQIIHSQRTTSSTSQNLKT